jgi:hypothetical protein
MNSLFSTKSVTGDDSIEYQCRACYGGLTPGKNKHNGGFCHNYYVPHRQGSELDPPSPYTRPAISVYYEAPIDCGVDRAIGLDGRGYLRCMDMDNSIPYCTRGVGLNMPSRNFRCTECLNSVPSKNRKTCVPISKTIPGCERYGRNKDGSVVCSKCREGTISRGTTCILSPIKGCLVDTHYIPPNFYNSVTEVENKLRELDIDGSSSLLGARKTTTTTISQQAPAECLRCDYENGYYSSDYNECTKKRN